MTSKKCELNATWIGADPKISIVTVKSKILHIEL